MKTAYLLPSLLASFEVTANPFFVNVGALHSEVQINRAPDPPPAGTSLPTSRDGVMPDGTVINYTPNNPLNRKHSCWTVPRSRPPVDKPYVKGTCSVCVLQRKNRDSGADYEYWARDDQNNAMGNMGGGVTIWPVDAEVQGGNNQSTTLMGQSTLQLYSTLGTNANYSMVRLQWEGWEVDFDPSLPANPQGDCFSAGTALAGAANYVQCFFDC